MHKIVSILFAAVGVVFTALFIWYGQQPVAVKKATWQDVLAEAQKGGYQIITTEELAKRYRIDPGSIHFVDTRQEWEFRSGHIEGARNFPMEPTWRSRWSKADELENFLGPDKGAILVFY